jgi:periplasmic protein TonB
MATAQINPGDRLTFTLFLAATLHAALILGVGFTAGEPDLPPPTIEVTLARYADAQAPEQADFIAQSHQQGSGTEAEVMETTAEHEAAFQSNEPQPVKAEAAPREASPERREVVTTVTRRDEHAPDDALTPEEPELARLDMSRLSYDELAAEIASLEARIDRERQELAKGPRVKRLTSVSTKSAEEAAYLNAWRQRVERVGNANYPAAACTATCACWWCCASMERWRRCASWSRPGTRPSTKRRCASCAWRRPIRASP